MTVVSSPLLSWGAAGAEGAPWGLLAKLPWWGPAPTLSGLTGACCCQCHPPPLPVILHPVCPPECCYSGCTSSLIWRVPRSEKYSYRWVCTGGKCANCSQCCFLNFSSTLTTILSHCDPWAGHFMSCESVLGKETILTVFSVSFCVSLCPLPPVL